MHSDSYFAGHNAYHLLSRVEPKSVYFADTGSGSRPFHPVLQVGPRGLFAVEAAQPALVIVRRHLVQNDVRVRERIDVSQQSRLEHTHTHICTTAPAIASFNRTVAAQAVAAVFERSAPLPM